MKIYPIVEGHGEVSAVPALLRRLQEESGAYQFEVGKAIRRNRSDFLNQDALAKAIDLVMLQPDCRAILILFDSHDDCPKELGPQVKQWAQKEAGAMPCEVVMACREYEAWFLAAMESLRGRRGILADASSHPTPEGPSGAKEQLEDRMDKGTSYHETLDQAPLTAQFDLAQAYARCRSFRRMIKAFGQLASGMGVALVNWPPIGWQAQATQSPRPKS